MAPAMAIAAPIAGGGEGKLGLLPAACVEALLRRNAELEREVRERRAKEAEMERELERTRERLRATEEAEERLCSELGELEAEALAHARIYRHRIKDLADRLADAERTVVR